MIRQIVSYHYFIVKDSKFSVASKPIQLKTFELPTSAWCTELRFVDSLSLCKHITRQLVTHAMNVEYLYTGRFEKASTRNG